MSTRRRSTIHLTPGEHQVLKLLNEGMSEAQIAKQLGYRKHTVFVYVSYARAKIGGNSRWEMIEHARRVGLVRTPRGAKRPPLMQLTRRQKRILEMLRRHLGTAEIGLKLGEPKRTSYAVEAQILRLRQSFRVRTNLELVDAAINAGILEGEKPKLAPNMFTERECQILDGLFLGKNDREIAVELKISGSNVRTRISRMQDKLSVTGIEELLDEVERRKLFKPKQKRVRLVDRATVVPPQPRTKFEVFLKPQALDVLRAFHRWPKKTYPELADHLGIQVATLKQWVVVIQRRLGVRPIRRAVDRACELGILPSPPRKLPPYEIAGLTKDQHRVLELLARGYSVKRIARMLDRDSTTIHVIAKTLVVALGATSRENAVEIARRRKLI